MAANLDKRTQDMITGYVPSGELLNDLKDFFSVFSDGTRLKLVAALAISNSCVTDLSNILNINQTTVSHQLRLLKNLGVVICVRDGKFIKYGLKNELVNDVILKGVEFLSS